MKLFTSVFTKLLSRIILLFLTFFIGLAGFLIWLQMSSPVLTVCEIAKNPKHYQGKTVRLLAFVQTHRGYFLFRDESCDFKDLDATISLPEGYEPQSEELRNFMRETNENYLSAQTIIAGEIDTEVQYQHYSPLFVINATKVELTSEIAVEIPDESLKNSWWW